MTIKFGFNIDAGAIEDRSYLVNTLKAGKFKAHLVMANPPSNEDPRREIEQAVIRLRSEVGDPDVQWIYRRYSKNEGDWRKFNVEDEARRWEREGYKDVIRQDPANEPGDTDNAEYVKSRIRLLELAHNAGITLCVGTWGVGGPHHRAIETGVYDDLIRALDRYGGMLDVHEYIPIMPEFGSIYGYEAILDPKQYEALEVREPWPVRSNHWIGRRLDNWLLRADAIGVPRPMINVSEVLWDKIPDAETKLNNQGGKWDAFQKAHSSGPLFNGDVRGVLSLEAVFRSAYPNLTYPQALFHTWKRWYEMLYASRPEVFSTQAFQWGLGWRFPETHDWSHKPIQPFISSIVHYSNSVEDQAPVLVPDPTTVPMQLTKVRGIAKGARIRKLPTVQAEILNATILDQTVEASLSDKPYWSGSGLNWYRFAGFGLQGFVADSVIEIVDQSFPTSEVERLLIAAVRAENWDAVVQMLGQPGLRFLDAEEEALLEALSERNMPLAVKKLLDVYGEV